MNRDDNGCIRVERHEDMSRLGQLRLIKQPDGDVIIVVVPDPDQPSYLMKSVEFCLPGSGGGRSRHTLKALNDLMIAMDRDNTENPIGD